MPSTAAASGPRKTMAMISARKLPEMRSLAAPVRIACRSDAMAQAASATSSATSSDCQSRLEKTMNAPTASATALIAIASRAGLVADKAATREKIGRKRQLLERGVPRGTPVQGQMLQEILRDLKSPLDRSITQPGKASEAQFPASQVSSTTLEAHNPESFRL